jgi:hypothetical protein
LTTPPILPIRKFNDLDMPKPLFDRGPRPVVRIEHRANSQDKSVDVYRYINEQKGGG